METKIDESVLAHLKTLCRNLLTGDLINRVTMSKAKYLVMMHLDKKGYSYSRVKCDNENNPPSSIDSGVLIVEIIEKETIYKLNI